MRPGAVSLLIAALLLSPGRGAAQSLPFDWRNRTLVGASYERFYIENTHGSAAFAALHVTHIGDSGVEPDFSAASYVGGGGFAFLLGFGIGPQLASNPLIAYASGGPGLLLGGPGLAFNLHAGAGIVIRAGNTIGLRLAAEHQWYLLGSGGNKNLGAWVIEMGVTGLGQTK